jgi:platelet-activating factor acetylhydrolase
MLGHSFGAATTVEVLRSHQRFSFIGQGIIYDIWGAAIQPPTWDPGRKIHTPLLAINSEAFMYWPDNFQSVMKLCAEAKDEGQLVWLLTVRGTVHISQSDFSILYPHLCSLMLKMTVNPRRALDLNINASLEFLKLVMPKRLASMNRGTDEGLLKVEKLEKIPSQRRPEEGYIGVRLRIPHEFLMRATPHWVRRILVKKRLGGKEVSRDPDGRPLEGLQDLEEGGEIWMHVAPTAEELEEHGLEGQGLETREEEEVGGDGMVTPQERGSGSESPGLEQRMMQRG